LIDLHKNQFSALRQTAIQGAMKSKPGEKIEDIQKRTTRRDWRQIPAGLPGSGNAGAITRYPHAACERAHDRLRPSVPQ